LLLIIPFHHGTTGKTSILSEYLRGLDKDTDKLLCVLCVL